MYIKATTSRVDTRPISGWKYGPLMWALRPFREILGTLKGTYRVCTRYIRIQGLRAHIRGPWFQPLSLDAKRQYLRLAEGG